MDAVRSVWIIELHCCFVGDGTDFTGWKRDFRERWATFAREDLMPFFQAEAEADLPKTRDSP